jgi:putative DNA primase/helicase
VTLKRPSKPQPRIVPVSDFKPVSVNWLWEPYIPAGKITLVYDDPGIGKTYFLSKLASAVSSGKPTPDIWGESGDCQGVG